METCLSSLTWASRNSVTQSTEELAGCSAEDTQRFHCSGLKDVTGLYLNVLLLLLLLLVNEALS